MQVNVDVSHEIINWLMAHVQIDSLPRQIQEYLHLWSAGKKTPTFNQIERTSRATGIPLGYFFYGLHQQKTFLWLTIGLLIVLHLRIQAVI